MKMTFEVNGIDELKELHIHISKMLNIANVFENIKVKEMPLSIRTKNSLLAEGIDDLEKIMTHGRSDLMEYTNFTAKSANEITDYLKTKCLELTF